MKHHVKKCAFTFMDFVSSFFSDLCSFRNKITVYICILTFYCIYTYKNNTTVVLTALGILDSYLIYYLHNRKKTDPGSDEKAPK